MLNFHRLWSLIRKEFYQISRDYSTFLIGLVLPLMLIVLIGSGMSMDVKNVKVTVVLEDMSPTATDVVSFLNGSDYFTPTYVTSMAEAVKRMDDRDADAIVRIPSDFISNLRRGSADIQVIMHGVNSTIAMNAQNYIEAGIGQWQVMNGNAYWHGKRPVTINVVARQWFNDTNDSAYMFIPGLIVIVITLVGVFLTSLVMAREWERGTLEALFATPVRPIEIVVSKIVPYFTIALLGFLFCLAIAVFGYNIPIKGSFLLLLFGSMEYILVAVGMGLTISSITKNQFLACQVALLASLLPTVMLTGFVFDLHSVPAVVRFIGQLLPGTYYMELIKTLLLAGNNSYIVTRDCALLAGYAVFFLTMSVRVTKKRI